MKPKSFMVFPATLKKMPHTATSYVMNVDGSDVKRLTRTPKSENNAVWINGGARIAFLYPGNGINQVWSYGCRRQQS